MGKRRHFSKTNVGSKPKKVRSDDEDEDTTSDSDSDWGNTNSKNLTIQSGEDNDGSESDDEALVNIAKNDKKLDVS